jgi:hypothetical protein
MIRSEPRLRFMGSLEPWLRAFLDKDRGRQQIARWIQMLRNDALRLQRFEKDELVLVIGAIRGGHEGP